VFSVWAGRYSTPWSRLHGDPGFLVSFWLRKKKLVQAYRPGRKLCRRRM